MKLQARMIDYTQSKEPWYNNKSGLTEKYVTEKETQVGTPEVNFLITKYK